MTSTTFSERRGGAMIFHDFKRTLRRFLGAFIIGICGLLFLIPFSTACIPGDSIFDVNVDSSADEFRLIGEKFVLPAYIYVILLGCITG